MCEPDQSSGSDRAGRGEFGRLLGRSSPGGVYRDAAYQAASDSLSECLVVLDIGGEVVFADAALRGVLGHEPAAVEGEHVTKLVPDAADDADLAALADGQQPDDRTTDRRSTRLSGRRADGSDVPLVATVHPFTHDGSLYGGCVLREVTEDDERRERLAVERAFVESVFDALPDVVYAFDTDGRFLRWNDRVTEVTGYTDEEMETLEPLEFIPESDHDRIGSAIDRVLTEGTVEAVESALVTADGREIPYEFTGAPLVDDGEIFGLTGVGRDVTRRKHREERLRRLDALNTVIRSVDQALIEATTREDVESAVPDRLVSDGGYVGAVLGRFEGDDRFRVDAASGVGVDGVDGLVPTGAAGLAGEARETTAVQVRRGLRSADGAEGRHAREYGYRSVAAVPLVADRRSFGVLGVYSNRADAFGQRERTILLELGEGIANAIQGALTRQLLYADTITEIELRTTDDDVAFVALAAAADCRFELERVVSYGEELVFYATAMGTAPSTVTELASDQSTIDAVDHLGTDGDQHLFEFVTHRATLTGTLIEHGARTTDAEAEAGVARLTAELPPDENVRSVVGRLQSTYPETKLVARREVSRSVRRPEALPAHLTADLTEKQRGALEAAYFGGYFEWPSRPSTAEDLADMLDIAPQTFHQHLRIAQRKLLTAVFENEGPRSE